MLGPDNQSLTTQDVVQQLKTAQMQVKMECCDPPADVMMFVSAAHHPSSGAACPEGDHAQSAGALQELRRTDHHEDAGGP